MPIEPPWPDKLLEQLRAIRVELQHRAAAAPQNTAIPAITADVEAAIAKLEPLVKSTTHM
jgi:hypothetical protein